MLPAGPFIVEHVRSAERAAAAAHASDDTGADDENATDEAGARVASAVPVSVAPPHGAQPHRPHGARLMPKGGLEGRASRRRATRSMPPPRGADSAAADVWAGCFAPSCFAPTLADAIDDESAFRPATGGGGSFVISADEVASSGCYAAALECGAGGARAADAPPGLEIRLNVYRFTRLEKFGWLEGWGVGIYHSAIEIRGVEYTFESTTGVYVNAPNAVPGCEMAETLSLGHTPLEPDEIEDVVDGLLPDFQPSSYNVLRRNCHHFSDELCFRLLGQHLPSWINRAARVGTAIGLAETPPGGRAVRRRSSRSAAKAAATEARSRDAEAQPRAAEAQTREMPPATPVRAEESSCRRVARS